MAAQDKHPNFRYTDNNGRQRVVKAHRVAWEDKHGPLDEGAGLKRCCTNTHCVNPDHMRVAATPEGRPRLLTLTEEESVAKLFREGKTLIEIALTTRFAPSQLKPVQQAVESELRNPQGSVDSQDSTESSG